jgi:hypothetical protein
MQIYLPRWMENRCIETAVARGKSLSDWARDRLGEDLGARDERPKKRRWPSSDGPPFYCPARSAWWLEVRVSQLVVGMDEAGRGAEIGPLVVQPSLWITSLTSVGDADAATGAVLTSAADLARASTDDAGGTPVDGRPRDGTGSESQSDEAAGSLPQAAAISARAAGADRLVG